MKSKLTLLLTSAFLLGVVACTKTTNTVSSNPNPNITVNDSAAILLNGVSKAFYASDYSNDSLIIINTDATDSSVVKNISSISNVPKSTNYLLLLVNSNNTVSQTTYSASSNVLGTFQANGITYQSTSVYPTSITIETIGKIYVTGTYSSKVLNLTYPLTNTNPRTITGRFKANF